MELPKIYEFTDNREKEIMLNRNFKRVNQEVEDMVKELLGMVRIGLTRISLPKSTK